MRIKKILLMAAFMLCISINAFFTPLIANASTGDMQETLTVDAVWIEGEMLQIDVTDVTTGEKQKLELRLKDYTDDSEYVSIQAVDLDGHKSNIVQIKNPYYKKPAEIKEPVIVETEKTNSESAIPTKAVPFTPAGTGEVMDNAKDGDGKEFFTIKTPNDNVFHLIIDRQRSSDNVYLLNAVTEADLMALAEKGDGKTSSAIPTTNTTPTPTPEPTPTPQPEHPKTTSNSTGTFAFIGIAMLVVGGIGYYFKIYKPKQDGANTESDNEGEMGEVEDDEDYEYESYDDEPSEEENPEE